MKTAGGERARTQKRILAATLCVLAASATPATADRSWLGGDGVWSNPWQWTPFGLPGVGDVTRLGNLPGSEVDLVSLDQDVIVSGLEITDGVRFRTLGHRMTMFGDTLVSGEGVHNGFPHQSSLWIIGGDGPLDFRTDDLSVIGAGAVIEDARIRVDERLYLAGVSSYLQGYGEVLLASAGTALQNETVISTDGGDLTFNALNGGSIDLDGFFGNGRLVTKPGNTLTFNGGDIQDEFNGSILIREAARVDLNFDTPWEAGNGSEILFTNYLPGPHQRSRLRGADVTLGGDVIVDVDHEGVIESSFVATPDLSLKVRDEGQLYTVGEGVVEGGAYDLGLGSFLRFQGPTEVQGGVFTTHSDSGGHGWFAFEGGTHYTGGELTVHGTGRQNADLNHPGGIDAVVSGATVINADTFDLDGSSDPTHWDIYHTLEVNAGRIDLYAPSQQFDGTMDIGGALFARLDLNLADPGQSWEMDGEMNLNGAPALFLTRVSGTPMRMTGELNVSSRAGVSADTTFAAGSATTLAGAVDRLRMNRVSRVEAGAEFHGVGELRNGATGHMTLADGASTEDVGLVNQGLLDIDQHAGIAAVDRFDNRALGTLAIDVGGHLLGDEHDHLMVNGLAEIDGVLAVDLLTDDFGDPVFLPQLGDEFLILTSLGGVSGQFADVLPTIAGGMAYGWEVLYHPHDITIRLASVGVAVPEPTTLAMAACGVAAAVGRRRSAPEAGRSAA